MSGSASGGKLQLPTYVPFQGPKPDLPGTPQGVADAYFRYPKDLVKSVQTPPGKGDDVTVFTNPAGAPPPPLDQNPTWQRINKDLNANFKLNLAGTAQDAAAKLNTIVAGGDLPDLLFLGPVSGGSLAGLPDFLEAKCADLTPFLSGDNIKAYPNLANYPTFAWRGTNIVFNNKIFGVPVVRAVAGSILQLNQTIADKAGVKPDQIKSGADLKKALQAITDPKSNVYGIGDQNVTLTPQLAAAMYGAPNNWSLDKSGKLVKDYETDQFKAGLGYLRDLWAAGVYHPDSLTYTNVSAGQAIQAGKFAFYYYIEDAFQITWAAMLQAHPDQKLSIVPPFSQDGSTKPTYFLGSGNFGGSVLKKASPDRIKEVLGVLNYFGAPFGSQEQLLLNFGIEGTDFTFDANGNPVPKPDGWANHPVPWAFMTHAPVVTYTSFQSKDFATLIHGFESAAIPLGIHDATLGLYSQTNGKTGPVIKQAVQDGITAIVTGRQPLSDWDQIVKDWQTKGGNTIRDEYHKALDASKAA
jgi:putative aldouronate transport system substrate-binding protein